MDPNPNLCMIHVTPASQRFKLSQMTPDRATVNTTLSKIWPHPSFQPSQAMDASDLNLTGRHQGGEEMQKGMKATISEGNQWSDS